MTRYSRVKVEDTIFPFATKVAFNEIKTTKEFCSLVLLIVFGLDSLTYLKVRNVFFFFELLDNGMITKH